jgi:hypothetical protein
MPLNGEGLKARFRDVVTTEEELRAVLGTPNKRVDAKVISMVDEEAARFIAASPFVLIATANAHGEVDVSPKGDPAGFVKVLDEKTLAIPDRLGNRRIDSFRNILENPDVGLIFLIPGVNHTLRVSGKAIIVRDEALRQTMAVGGRIPDHAIVVGVERVLSHCPKCMIRSHLWQPDAWPDAGRVPSLAEILVAHTQLPETVDDIQAILDNDAVERLY